MEAQRGGSSDEGLSLQRIDISAELWHRGREEAEAIGEAEAMRRIADIISADPDRVFPVCAEVALELCDAGSAAVSRCQDGPEGPICRWAGIAGEMRSHPPPPVKLSDSPGILCGERSGAVLLSRPAEVFPKLAGELAFCETLLVPLAARGSGLEGAIWAIAHDPAKRFTGAHARVLERVALFTTTTLHLAEVAGAATARAEESDLRYRELDHRIKNILTLTVSLLRHQMKETPVAEAREALDLASTRVVALGRLHSLEADRASGNLEAVVSAISRVLVEPDERFRLHLDLEPVATAPHRAATIALIVSELVINALKHGLRGREEGTITVRLARGAESEAILSVSDDGEPLPSESSGRVAGRGLGLLEQLARHMGGEMRVEAEPKAFSLRFPLEVA